MSNITNYNLHNYLKNMQHVQLNNSDVTPYMVSYYVFV